jgi:flagellar biosynthetic protein FlhB
VFAQVGPYLEAAPLRWRLDQLNPVNGLKRLAPNLENILKLLMALIKISAIAALTYLAIRRDLGQLVTLPLISPLAGFMWVSGRCLVLALKVLVLFVGVAAIDYAYRRHEYYEKLKMTKQEVRDEHRNQEGDPMVKGRRRRRMRELTLARLMTEVPQADVVVVNPTHVAVALRYAPGMPAPRVVAKGLRKRALRIRRIAEGAGVPVVHEPPLARALYRQTRTGGYIPSDFFRAVALVLAQLQRTGTRSFTS